MEELKGVVYGKGIDKSLHTKVSTIQVMHGGRYMIHRPSKCLQQDCHATG